MSGTKGSPTDAASWLRRETPKHLDLLTKLRETLEQTLTTRVVRDADGGDLVIPADLNENGTPTRAWCRVLARYQAGWNAVMGRELEFRKLQILASRIPGQQPLTDEEYEREMAEIGREALGQLDDGEIAAELIRRRARLSSAPAGDPEPD